MASKQENASKLTALRSAYEMGALTQEQYDSAMATLSAQTDEVASKIAALKDAYECGALSEAQYQNAMKAYPTAAGPSEPQKAAAKVAVKKEKKPKKKEKAARQSTLIQYSDSSPTTSKEKEKEKPKEEEFENEEAPAAAPTTSDAKPTKEKRRQRLFSKVQFDAEKNQKEEEIRVLLEAQGLAMSPAPAPSPRAPSPQGATKEQKQQATVLYAEGEALLEARSYSEAIEKLESAAKLDPSLNDNEVLLSLVSTAEMMRDAYEASAAPKKTKATPSFADAIAQLDASKSAGVAEPELEFSSTSTDADEGHDGARTMTVTVSRDKGGFGMAISASGHIISYTGADSAGCLAGVPLKSRITAVDGEPCRNKKQLLEILSISGTEVAFTLLCAKGTPSPSEAQGRSAPGAGGGGRGWRAARSAVEVGSARGASTKKDSRQRQQLAQELLESEKTYIDLLQSVVTSYMNPLLAKVDGSPRSPSAGSPPKGSPRKKSSKKGWDAGKGDEMVLSTEEIHIIFGGVLTLVEAHQGLRVNLQRRVTGMQLHELSSEHLVAGMRQSFRSKALPASVMAAFEEQGVSGAVVSELDEQGWDELLGLLGISSPTHKFAIRRFFSKGTWRRTAGSAPSVEDSGWTSTQCLGNLFLGEKFDAVLSAYSAYVGMFTSIQQLIAELADERPFFFRFLMEKSKNPLVAAAKGGAESSDDHSTVDARSAAMARLNSFLTLPMSRLPRYVALLRQLTAITPSAHPDCAELCKAVSHLQDTQLEMQERATVAQNMADCVRIRSMINFGKSRHNGVTGVSRHSKSLGSLGSLVDGKRGLLREGWLMERSTKDKTATGKKKIKERFFVVFNDMIIKAKGKGKSEKEGKGDSRMLFRGQMPIDERLCTTPFDNSKSSGDTAHCIVFSHPKAVPEGWWYICFRDAEEKDEWLRIITPAVKEAVDATEHATAQKEGYDMSAE